MLFSYLQFRTEGVKNSYYLLHDCINKEILPHKMD